MRRYERPSGELVGCDGSFYRLACEAAVHNLNPVHDVPADDYGGRSVDAEPGGKPVGSRAEIGFESLRVNANGRSCTGGSGRNGAATAGREIPS